MTLGKPSAPPGAPPSCILSLIATPFLLPTHCHGTYETPKERNAPLMILVLLSKHESTHDRPIFCGPRTDKILDFSEGLNASVAQNSRWGIKVLFYRGSLYFRTGRNPESYLVKSFHFIRERKPMPETAETFSDLRTI